MHVYHLIKLTCICFDSCAFTMVMPLTCNRVLASHVLSHMATILAYRERDPKEVCALICLMLQSTLNVRLSLHANIYTMATTPTTTSSFWSQKKCLQFWISWHQTASCSSVELQGHCSSIWTRLESPERSFSLFLNTRHLYSPYSRYIYICKMLGLRPPSCN